MGFWQIDDTQETHKGFKIVLPAKLSQAYTETKSKKTHNFQLAGSRPRVSQRYIFHSFSEAAEERDSKDAPPVGRVKNQQAEPSPNQETFPEPRLGGTREHLP